MIWDRSIPRSGPAPGGLAEWRCVPQPAVSSCNKMRSRSSRSFSDHVQTHPVVDRAARSAITTMAVRIKVMAGSAMSLAV